MALEKIEEDKPVSVWSIAIRKWSLSDKWGIRAGLDRAVFSGLTLNQDGVTSP